MRMYDILLKKRNGAPLSPEEIRFFIKGVTGGSIPDYQISAFLMAVYYSGMTAEETLHFTKEMANSGDTVDLSLINGVKADKHSTGGVGDKTSLIVAPIVASCGVSVAKMSGRGLGHTGGTIDKLESIPGFNTNIPVGKFIEIVNKIGICIIGQTGNLAPADKKLYALRDVTATVDSIPLIAASIMSKKLAAGADTILLDVKAGTGAFMKDIKSAQELAEIMVSIGKGAGKNTAALITGMDKPLGYAIGNSLEIIEAANTLKNKGAEDLTQICIKLAGMMLYQAKKGSLVQCEKMAAYSIASGAALKKLIEMVQAQGGNPDYIRDTRLFKPASIQHAVVSPKDGYIAKMNTESCGIASAILGAGRQTKESHIDYNSGIIMVKKTGDYVLSGEVTAYFHTNDEKAVPDAETIFLSAIEYSDEKPQTQPLIYGAAYENC